jgi:hypothetical protein
MCGTDVSTQLTRDHSFGRFEKRSLFKSTRSFLPEASACFLKAGAYVKAQGIPCAPGKAQRIPWDGKTMAFSYSR